MTTSTCTVSRPASQGGGPCGAPAVYVEKDLGECAKHAAQHGSLASTRRMIDLRPAVGDSVDVARHGHVYVGRVSRVTRGGVVYATVTYGSGSTREVRV